MSDHEPTLGEIGIELRRVALDVTEVKAEVKDQRERYLTRVEHAQTMEVVNRELQLRREETARVDRDVRDLRQESVQAHEVLRDDFSATMWKAVSVASGLVTLIVSVIGLLLRS